MFSLFIRLGSNSLVSDDIRLVLISNQGMDVSKVHLEDDEKYYCQACDMGDVFDR